MAASKLTPIPSAIVVILLVVSLSDCGGTDSPQGPGVDALHPDATETADGCTPSCVDRQCGSDGCGGTCGTCPAGATCDETGYCRSENCGAAPLTVSGLVATDLGDLVFDSATVVVKHKQDVDPAEDRCVVEVVLELRKGSGCLLRVRAAEVAADDGTLEILEATLSADSQCPGFADEKEGEYALLASAGAGSVDPGVSNVPDANAPTSCFPATLRVDLHATLNRAAPVPSLDLVVTSSTLVITGDVTSTGDPAADCPCVWSCSGRECGDDGCGRTCGGCGCGEQCVEGSCIFDACENRECGTDGCGGSCGDCPTGRKCSGGQCVCTGSADNDCDSVDDDCDGSTDEDYIAVTTTCGTGACAATGKLKCVGGVESDTCVPGSPSTGETTCDGVDNDCDGETDEDYVSIPTVCGIGACARVGAVECIDGGEKDSCTPGSPTVGDLPDPAGTDDDCDGIDGQWSIAVLVDDIDPAATDDGNTVGDASKPFKTVNAAVNFAQAQGKTHVYVSRGTYTEQVLLQNGISLYGGYDAALAWSRNVNTNQTVLQWDGVSDGQVVAVLGKSLSSATSVDGFSILSGSNPTKGGGSYGIYLWHTGQNVALSHNRIVAGNGGDGQDGTAGGDGLVGESGANGGATCDYGAGTLATCTASCASPAVGNGGLGHCDNAGGAGGNGGSHNASGVKGAAAVGGAKGGVEGGKGAVGQNGENGKPGVPGQAGWGGFAHGYIDDSGFWRAYDGEDGTNGSKGWGGGGGGGGGGDTVSFVDIECYEYGAAGGGAGGGGCQGTAGKMGTGGGGSVAIIVVDGQATISGNEISCGNGGNGGDGGKGGLGGIGGAGGSGGVNVQANVGSAAAGGNGGTGGDGGSGGPGGGGGGGISYGIYLVGNSILACSDNLFSQGGFPGVGGTGGDGSAHTQGASGDAGDINQPSASCQPND